MIGNGGGDGGGGGGGTIATYRDIELVAGGVDLPSSNYAPFSTYVGINQNIQTHLFDNVVEKSYEFQFKMLNNLDTTRPVLFYVDSFSEVDRSGENLAYKLQHSGVANGESVDKVLSTLTSPDLLVGGGDLNLISNHSFSETLANLDWVAFDQIKCIFSFTPATVNPYGWPVRCESLLIRIPIILSVV